MLQRTWDAYRDQGVTFLGIAVWDNEAEINSFVQRYGITYPISFDSQGTIAVDFGLTGLPEKCFFDRDGMLRRKFIGPMTEEALREALEFFLAEARGEL